ncbi:MAG: hypothetical protein QOI80_1656 [Solirubrobacteraceae bacterium]|jgi:hypothetical protein|nr:hypothetical protein [Solirubrobacteraceae bacterium]
MNRTTIRNTLASVAALGALALGGSALADAASSPKAKSGTAGSARSAPPQRPAGRHVGANGQREQALSASDAAKVKAAALAKYPGATIERVETDVDHGSPFEAHLATADGKQLEVLVDSSFTVTGANTMQHP